MPGGDRTGPMGEGPMTGRAMGFCAQFPVPGRGNRRFGAGRLGLGRGRGRGWRNWFYATGLTGWQRAALGQPAWGKPAAAAPSTEAQELAVLKQQAENLSQTLEQINQRIEEIEKQASQASS